MDLNHLFDLANQHRNEHDCSAHPYENYQKLFDLTSRLKPKRILEIGTGIGFSAVVMALASKEAMIDTIEKDSEHFLTARQFLQDLHLQSRIKVYNDIAEVILPNFTSHYDLIFFDGFQIHYEFLQHYARLLVFGGTLILANTHLNSKTSEQFFTEIGYKSEWELLDQFSDTMIFKKLSKDRV